MEGWTISVRGLCWMEITGQGTRLFLVPGGLDIVEKVEKGDFMIMIVMVMILNDNTEGHDDDHHGDYDHDHLGDDLEWLKAARWKREEVIKSLKKKHSLQHDNY